MATRLQKAKDFVKTRAHYEFTNDDLLVEALDTTGMRRPESNQRLALMGDSVLGLSLICDWYPTGKAKRDGNNSIQDQASNRNLAHLAQLSGLDAHIVMHPGHRGPIPNGPLATTFEALVGAIYWDCGRDLDICTTALRGLGMML